MESTPIENCYWVVQGELLAGEYPRDRDDKASSEKLSRLISAGITAFIDLTEEGELEPYAQWLGTASHQRFPIHDASVPDSLSLTAGALNAIDQHIEDGEIVYVHCFEGIGRTGTIIGCWLARHGRTGRIALARLHELWRQCPKSRFRKSPETRVQEEYILRWQENR